MVNNFEKNKQQIVGSAPYFLEACELCEALALDIILNLEGLRYLAGPIYKQKGALKKGHYLTIKKSPFFIKVSVWRKEVNGFVFSGDLKKILEFHTVEMPAIHEIREPNEDFDKNAFLYVLEELEANSEKFIKKYVREAEIVEN